MAIFVTKRDGSKEPLDLDKVHKVVFWACEGLSGVSPSEVELRSKLTFHDGISTTEITETLIKAAADLISEEAPQYQYVAGRLVTYHLRKEVYGRFQPRRLFDLIKANVEAGFYDPELLTSYTEAEWDEIGDFVNHERDMGLTYVAMEQMRGKYLVQNRATKKILETPQVLYILVAAVLFSRYPAETRMKWVRDYYEAISKHEISLPTPIMAGVRTPKRQFSSCTLIETGDSLASINATDNAIVDYVANRAGIGLGAGRIRALGSKVRGGQVTHTGVTPFFKKFAASVNSCNQGGIRKGSATLHYMIWHYEIEDMLVLKNNKGTEENRVRAMDYSVQISKLFYERLIQGGNITLFSPNDVPDVYHAFFVDNDKFKVLYEAAEKDPTIRKKVVKALDLFTALMGERKDTGRIYIQNVDNCNLHGSFIEALGAIRMSNLCQEVTQVTVPMATYRTEHVTIPAAALPSFMIEAAKDDKAVKVLGTRSGYASRKPVLPVLERVMPASGRVDEVIEMADEPVPMVDVETTEDMSRIALCTLSAVNWGVVKSPKDFARICPLAVRGLDELLSYQGYPVLAARKHTEEYRPLGIGIINFAYFLAKNNAKYSDGSGLALTDEYAEAWSFHLIKASMELAREKGACKLSSHTKYAQGIVPIDTRKRDIDELLPHVERLDWAGLREDLKTYGIRNATLMALMPAETSAQIANATNGIEPPRNLISVKVSKEGVLKQVVPEIRKLKNKYELLWDQKSPVGYLQLCAILQKYIDQAISVNTSYNPEFYEDEKVPMSDLLKHLLIHYKLGGKTLYYCNTYDGQGELDVEKLNDAPLAQSEVIEDEDCDSCKI